MIDWYQLFQRELVTKEQPCEIEPKESESFHSDFIINDDVQTVSIYSYFKNQKKMGKELGWPCTTIHDVDGGTMKTENTEESDKKILKQFIKPEPDEDETRQRKPKPESPPIKGQVKQKPPSEETAQSKQKPPSEQKPKTEQ
jgi:hypothetical protein